MRMSIFFIFLCIIFQFSAIYAGICFGKMSSSQIAPQPNNPQEIALDRILKAQARLETQQMHIDQQLKGLTHARSQSLLAFATTQNFNEEVKDQERYDVIVRQEVKIDCAQRRLHRRSKTEMQDRWSKGQIAISNVARKPGHRRSASHSESSLRRSQGSSLSSVSSCKSIKEIAGF